ncbi:MAG: type I DNA topoisomerase [Chloroflexi bacterium]|nr:MAG: type I DNA topoisomerase [Chloroflexota bacterium]
MSKLVIVESPTKARTIGRFLPKDYRVEASMGHVRDLPASASEIPTKYKSEEWSRLGVNVEANFSPLYVIPKDKKKVVKELTAALKDAEELILATDEDREGESIAWHLTEVLKPQVPIKRMVFHEITPEAIREAAENCRAIDDKLVEAQETRRILDRLVGYTVSPLLWKKIAPGLSAGRVQSAAVRLLVLREQERRRFKSGAYWDLKATLEAHRQQFTAQLVALGGVRLATSKDFDETTGRIPKGKKVLLLGEEEARALVKRLKDGQWVVNDINEREQVRTPAPPFTTSTLQQEANRKLGLSSRQTMQIAQRLYEQGLITYMRTDSVNLSNQALQTIRQRVHDLYGQEYLSPAPRQYQTQSKGAQEAHEAIRPAGQQMPTADELRLSGQEYALYDLIWKRAMATQMADARLLLTTVTIEVEDAEFRATGKRVLFPGFFRAYVEGEDDPSAALDDQETILPPLQVGETVKCRKLEPVRHDTKPPARYTDATLVKALESEGIGRPSTYATIISTIQERGYVVKSAKQLIPTFTAFAVNHLMEQHFPDLVDTRFTAQMEQVLDDIAEGKITGIPYLKTFYLGSEGLEGQVRQKEEAIDPRHIHALVLDDLKARVRVGRFGAYLEQDNNGEPVRVSLPDNYPPADLVDDEVRRLLREKTQGPTPLGYHPESGDPVFVLLGPYGPYVQLGENGNNGGAKPRRVSLLKGTRQEDVTLEQALALLELPRTLGVHPDTGQKIQAGIGRFGPFVRHGDDYRSLTKHDNVLTIGLARALELLAQEKGKRRVTLLREIGAHPADGQPVAIYEGRYGPYVKHGKLNASLPKDAAVEQITLEQAVTLLTQKKAKPKKKAPPKTS